MNNNLKFGVSKLSESKIDKDSGTMLGVSLISVGPALGHDLFVDQTSLETIIDKLEAERLPAYITHKGAIFDDRLTREIGIFENFRVEEDRLIADFEAFESFRDDDSRKFNRLFELAEKMPERFGLSIVFSADTVWATEDGDVDTLERPDDALFDFPSVRVDSVSSADFVDSPAANERGLFSIIDKKPTSKMTKQELSEINKGLEDEKMELESKIHQLSIDKTTAEAELESSQAAVEESLDETSELKEEIEIKSAELEEMKAKLAEMEGEISEKDEELVEKDEELVEKATAEESLQAEATKLSVRVATLEKLIEGSDMVAASTEADDLYEPSKSNRSKVISEFAKEKGISEYSATLRLSKERPELFKI